MSMLDKNLFDSLIGKTVDITDEFLIMAYKFNNSDRSFIYVAKDLYSAQSIYEKFCYALGKEKVAFFPVDDIIRSKVFIKSKEFLIERQFTKEKLLTKNAKVIVTSFSGFLKKIEEKSVFLQKLKCLNNFTRTELLNYLFENNYQKEVITYNPGEYSVRGEVVDVFPLTSKNPYRITFFDEVIEDIKIYNSESQLTIEKLKQNVLITPRDEKVMESFIFDYVDSDAVIFYQNFNEAKAKFCEVKALVLKEELGEFDYFDIEKCFLPPFIITNSEIDELGLKSVKFKKRAIPLFCNQLNMLVSFLKTNKKPCTISYKTLEEKQILLSLLKDFEKVTYIEDKNYLSFETDALLFISSYDLFRQGSDMFGSYRSLDSKLHQITSLSELKIDDYIVHLNYGIGKFIGIKTFTFDHETDDYISIRYENKDLSVPVSEINLIRKYESLNPNPKLTKLGTSEWKNKKLKAKKEIELLAKQMLTLESTRKKIKAYKYAEDEEVQRAFENDFKYEETPDQLKVVKEIKSSLENGELVDRLILGDVGFGKTEIAMRIALKSVVNGFQVAYLAPTTILTKQHFDNFLLRFKKYGIECGLLNRYTSQKERTAILLKLRNGEIDILIGTHALLNEKVIFKNLNLLIIDEEQRFGVRDKQKITNIKQNVNVLTLSATPIPRTLQMALSKIRQLSIVKTAPKKKLSPQTFVLIYNDFVIKDAIKQELARQGQVFYLINDLAKHEEIKKHLESLIPTARIAVVHGQMKKQDLQMIMENFIERKYDILISTTIIETGIDIENANTLIVEDSQNFGLAQMYQLRGRIGRGDKLSFAYFTIPKKFSHDERVMRRLDAIKSYTELGSGYRLALEDLMIRGAGSILGTKQSGFINDIGLGTYLELLDEEFKKLQGEEKHDLVQHISVNRYIPESYVMEDELRIFIHKKILNIKIKKDYLDTLFELNNRFGEPSQEVKVYIAAFYLERLFEKISVSLVNDLRHKAEIHIENAVLTKLKPVKIMEIISRQKNAKVFFKTDEIVIEILKDTAYSYTWIFLGIDLFENLVENINS